MLNKCQLSSLMAATDGPVAEFSSFANFEERKRKSILLMSFPKIVHQKGSFGQVRKNPLFRFCRPILDIFGLTLLSVGLSKFDHISSALYDLHCLPVISRVRFKLSLLVYKALNNQALDYIKDFFST